MAEAILYVNGEPVRCRKMGQPKRPTQDRWVRDICRVFQKDIEAAGFTGKLPVSKFVASVTDIRVSFSGTTLAVYVDRTASEL